MTVKETILETLKNLPEETTFEEAIERIYLLYKVNKGLRDADEGRTFTNEEAKGRPKRKNPLMIERIKYEI